MVGISEDKATGVAYGGQQGTRTGSQCHETCRAATAARGGGGKMGTTHCRDLGFQNGARHRGRAPSPIAQWGLHPPLQARCPPAHPGVPAAPAQEHPPGGGAMPGGGAWSAALAPSPSWKAASGLCSTIPAL